MGFTILPIDIAHIIKSTTLPFYNRDPFDRILIAQAITEKMDFVTRDAIADLYLETETIRKIW